MVSRESSTLSMNLATLPSESQVMSTSVASSVGALVEPVDRHDGEERAERPVIEQRLEDREVAEVLRGELAREPAEIVGELGGIHLRGRLLDALGDAPERGLDQRLDVELEEPELEHLLRLFLDLEEVRATTRSGRGPRGGC